MYGIYSQFRSCSFTLLIEVINPKKRHNLEGRGIKTRKIRPTEGRILPYAEKSRLPQSKPG